MAADVLPDAATPFGQRVRARLGGDEVIWIVTVGADGRPQPNPVGFCRDGDQDSTEFIIYSRADAKRLRHLRERPDQVSFHFDSDGHGQDIAVLQGRVVIDDGHPAIKDWPPYLDKYGPAVERAFGNIVEFSASYPIACGSRSPGSGASTSEAERHGDRRRTSTVPWPPSTRTR